MVIVASMLLVILSFADWWRKHALDSVVYLRNFHFYRMFPGETSIVQLRMENNKTLPLPWLVVRDLWPRLVCPVHESNSQAVEPLAPSHIVGMGILENIYSLLWYERSVRTYRLLFQKRGVYQVGPTVLSTSDILGFYDIETSPEKQVPATIPALGSNNGPIQRLVVFPQPIKLSGLEFPQENPFGSRNSLRRLFEDPTRVIGIRQYHPEDEFRRIHWPATAHTGQLQVKIYQPTSAPVLVVALNATTSERYWDGFDAVKLEKMVSLAANFCIEGVDAGYMVGLLSNSCLRQADQPFRVPPGRSNQQLGLLLEALAAVSPLTSGRFEDVLLREAGKIAFGAVLLIITAVSNQEQIELLMRMRRNQRHIIVVSVADEPIQQVPGIQIVQVE